MKYEHKARYYSPFHSMKNRNSGIPKGSWALLVSQESKANGIPRKHPQHRTGSLAWCHSFRVTDIWQCHDCGWGMPYTSHWRCTEREQWAGLPQEGKRGFDMFGEERKGILLGKTDQGPPINNPPKIQPDPWISTVIPRGHCPLL